EIITCDPGCCGGCGADLAGAPVVKVQRRQIVELSAPPKPRVSEYRIVTRACAACGATAIAITPRCPPARVQYGPTVLARTTELVCAHYLPVARAARLMHSMAGVPVSEAERDVRPVKIQQRTSGGAWRTLTELADFAIVQPYLSTATKWGLDTLDALTQLFTGQLWLPPAPNPAE
ncbi:MAG: IS66 family transposase zinc-finger binding domain-containing protein, partial [Actinomycetota bacterium]|nr:IS66 family transposase zinc-finger binding domain-containing protein [Actinomycetota bacterium]